MQDDVDIINSPLEREVTADGIAVRICIYRVADEDEWILEVVDQEGGSTVWDDRFATDQAALDEAMSAIEAEGTRSFAESMKVSPPTA